MQEDVETSAECLPASSSFKMQSLLLLHTVNQNGKVERSWRHRVVTVSSVSKLTPSVNHFDDGAILTDCST